MCHISVQDGGKHAEVLVHAANSDHRQTCSCAVGNGTSRDGDVAAAVTSRDPSLFPDTIYVFMFTM